MNLERAIRRPRIELCWHPVPGQQIFKSVFGVILDPGQDICQVELRIMAVQFDRFDDGQDVGDALTALVRACE
jgi:hypothetical protein